ncbi:GTPase Era [Acidocella aminolytica]|jgi:GTP-binding protein Era|uniref:GTPase Era n=1 Tax=Acidocella aminolytica 101 = DSM 11237 TaxID=1120923 RepID=A0A0D6PEJ3_9PROT|nr:GTPase Era [Acidocella aminolytica]GAN79284.1 GTP-binding protein Era [Acidocella aminolytica 101 = DSM 11237]GBQ39646.1 GTP-binding protein Era [Acidocella aminolytica 101 = DSM 11237]SHE37560.1 GTP-binding protein Era [Acidocella aminolytica 101 = DSM 11237]
MTKCGFVALVGAPNAGKSTLLNRLTGAKISIVSPKAQTTRARVLGILVRDEAQIIFVDTPGIFAPKRRLDRAMVEAAWNGAGEADLRFLLVDAKLGLTDAVREIAAQLVETGAKLSLILNKVDLVERQQLLPLAEAAAKLAPFERVFMISAQTGDGIEELLDFCATRLPESPFLYPEDEMTDLPDRQLAAEIVREQIFLQTRDEVPYGTTVETESFKEQKNGAIRIDAVIYVAREGHKAILIGAKGARIKEIGSRARRELEKLLDTKVDLFLRVVERPGWDEEAARIRAAGLDLPRG